MKTLAKMQFLPFLKKISETLDKEEINHDIPFCHIDKMLFNQITIIIPDHIQSYDISEMFQCEYIKEKEGIIQTIIDGIAIDFVKTKTDDWYYTFYYYCWDILHVLVDIMVSKNFNLRYTRTGMKYEYKDKIIHVSKNMQEIFEFLYVPFHMINNGFPTDFTIFEFIESSTYFDYKDFTMENFEFYDPNFNLNKLYYENLLKHIPEVSIEKCSEDEQIVLIDIFFKDSNFLEKLSKIQAKEDFPNFKDLPKVSIDEMKSKVENTIKRKKIKFNKNVDDDLKYNIE